ncbi:MAG TPA: ABC transporter ATP-binding protein [Verrucomicrobiae bacterium]|nr:ABC transporter ATP-binding protein [Verrucomicrobiae bacterium]
MMALLQVNGLCKAFGAVRAVEQVDFKVQQGEIYGLLGPNGAGKTTTISMISGLLRPDAGKVAVDGADFWSDPARAQRIMGVVPQEIALYEELSGRENLEFWGRLAGLAAAEARRRAGEVLEALSLADRAKEPVKNYSGGMKRRINIGCALMHRPKLLLLDEPTVGIDPQARLNILEFVKKLCADGTAILYTTHYLEEAETLCHRIGIIDHGRLLAEGTLSELQKRLGGDQLFVLEGDLKGANPEDWPRFLERFRVIQKSDHQLSVASHNARHPSECLKDLLDLPVKVENVTLKRPSLNDVFLQLTGRQLRE